MIATSTAERSRTALDDLVGSGDRIGLFVLPFVLAGLALNSAFPPAFNVGGPPPGLDVVSIIVLIAGLTLWSVALILTIHLGSGRFAPEAEAELSRTFHAAWVDHCHRVKVPWL